MVTNGDRKTNNFGKLVGPAKSRLGSAALRASLSPLFHNGPDAYDWIMQQVIKPPSTGDLQDMTIEFWLIEIITDVGISANSIADSIR